MLPDSLFEPENLHMTCEALAMAGDLDQTTAARQKIAGYDLRHARYLSAFDPASIPVIVAGWTGWVSAGRAAAWPRSSELAKTGVRQGVRSLADIAAALRTANPGIRPSSAQSSVFGSPVTQLAAW